MASLRANIDHIKEIVMMQQAYAHFSGVAQEVSATELVEDAMKMHSASYSRHSVRLVREFSQTPILNTEKHKVLQILVNLLHNAKHACDASDRPDKEVTVRILANGGPRVKIQVKDNGIGIPAENLTRIFNHGFTTRKGGHGFGLHSGALAARELGGTLMAESDGTGKGALFTLELPLDPKSA
jgi:signal transduction histidine kinase